MGVFRADRTTGVVGSISECETIEYRATLAKAVDSSTLCAFSGGTFFLTTPEGVVHTIDSNVPCVGGTSGEGCDPTVTQVQSALIPYTVSAADAVGALVTATASYAGGVAHDQAGNTPGVSAMTPKSTPVVRCADANPCTTDACDPAKQSTGACSHTPVVCDDGNACTTDACDPASGTCVFAPGSACNDNNLCTTDTCNPATGQCAHVDTVTPTCDDHDKCTTDSCKPSLGKCVHVAKVCSDHNLCTTDSCDPSTGQCVFTRRRRY